jgi:hypothetical protein
MERDARPKTTNETSDAEHTGLDRAVTYDRSLCLDAADLETEARTIGNGATVRGAGSIRGRGS